MIYKVTDEAILITAFWDNRPAPQKLLELLKAVPEDGPSTVDKERIKGIR